MSHKRTSEYGRRLKQAYPAQPLSLPRFRLLRTFTSTLNYSEEQKDAAPTLEPSFEHLLRSSLVHESIILTLRIKDITDRDTFVNMFDSESTLKDGAADLGTDLVSGGLPHKREFARVVNGLEDSQGHDRDQDTN